MATQENFLQSTYTLCVYMRAHLHDGVRERSVFYYTLKYKLYGSGKQSQSLCSRKQLLKGTGWKMIKIVL